MKKNNKQYVLITGASSGIGFELARLFVKDDYNLVITARSQEELDKASRALYTINPKVQVITIAKDLFDYENAIALYREIRAQGIEITILVNNAGHGWYGKFEDTALEMELSIIQLNVCSLVVLTKLFLKDMLMRGEGKILNTSSIASKTPGPWQSVYHGTKAFVQSFTEAVRAEVKDQGITLTALLPGATDTDFFRKAHMEGSKVVEDRSKLADPAEVAQDGYEALMAGKDMVVSGVKNKMGVAIDAITSDEKLADKMYKQQEPSDRKE